MLATSLNSIFLSYLALACCLVKGWCVEHAADHIIVAFDPVKLQQMTGSKNGLPESDQLQLPKQTHLRERGLCRWRRGNGQTALSSAHKFEAYFLLDLPDGLTPEEAVRMARQSPYVRYAELDGTLTAAATVPNDPDFPLQWYHQNLAVTNDPVPADIRSVQAWDFTRGSSNVLVAVLDTGCNTELSEFAGRIVSGYDFVNNDSDPNDDNGHGTEVTGVLAATGNNETLIAGVDWNCRILPVKVLGADRSGLFSTVADGIDYAVNRGARIIVLSAGGMQNNITLSNSVMSALANGVAMVVAAHNDGAAIRFPARLPGVIAVGATLMNDRRASFSNFGPELSVVAPGTNIYTFGRFGVHVSEWGTSVAAPQAAGAAALLLALRPELRGDQLRELLCAGADDQVGPATEDIPGFDSYFGYGRLNVLGAIQIALVTPSIEVGPNGLILSWKAATNAAAKRPYELESSDSSTGPWERAASREDILIRDGIASWRESAPDTGSALQPSRFFRVLILK